MFIEALRREIDKQTQQGFASKCGCSQPVVSRVLSGDYMPKAEILMGITSVLGIPFEVAFEEIQANKAKAKKEKAAG